jgi:hypothetical protein
MGARAKDAAFGSNVLGTAQALSWRLQALRNRLAGTINKELREAQKDAMGMAWDSQALARERQLLEAALKLLLAAREDPGWVRVEERRVRGLHGTGSHLGRKLERSMELEQAG